MAKKAKKELMPWEEAEVEKAVVSEGSTPWEEAEDEGLMPWEEAAGMPTADHSPEGLMKALGEGLGGVAETYDKYLDAPGRAGVSAAIEEEDWAEKPGAYAGAAWEQVGQDPEGAPSYQDIAGELGFSDEPWSGRASLKGDVYDLGGEDVSPQEAAAVGMSMVGSYPVSVLANIPGAPAKMVMGAKGVLKGAAKIPTLPFKALVKISGTDGQALKTYFKHTDKVNEYINHSLKKDPKNIANLSALIKQKFNTRVGMFVNLQNRVIGKYLKNRRAVDIDVTDMFNVFDDYLSQLNPAIHGDELVHIARIKKQFLRGFDDAVEGTIEGYRSRKTGKIIDEDDLLRDKDGRIIGYRDIIEGEPVNIRTTRQIVGPNNEYLVDAQTAYDYKKKLQDIAFGKGVKEEWITKAPLFKKAMGKASGSVRNTLHSKVPEVKTADMALSKIHVAQELIKKSLMDPTASPASLARVGGASKGGDFQRRLLESLDELMTDPNKMDELDVFQDTFKLHMDELAANSPDTLKAYAEALDMSQLDLARLMDRPEMRLVQEQQLPLKGVPQIPGFGPGDPTSQIVKEADLLHSAQEFADPAYIPKTGAFLGYGTALTFGAMKSPESMAGMFLLGTLASPKAIKAAVNTGHWLRNLPMPALEMLKKAGIAVKDGAAFITPDQYKDVVRSLLGSPVKMSGWAAEKTHEILTSPQGEELLGKAIREVFRGERVMDTVNNEMSIKSEEQASVYAQDVKKDSKLSNIDKFKRIQKANTERKAIVELEKPKPQAPKVSAPDPSVVFDLLKGTGL